MVEWISVSNEHCSFKAAQGGDPEGAAHLGACCCNEVGTAANAGIGLAEYELGICYSSGNGIPKDMDKAIKLCQLASSHDYSAAKRTGVIIFFVLIILTEYFSESSRYIRKDNSLYEN